MPITLPPISRRRFLAGSAAAVAAVAMSRWSFAEDQAKDPNHFVLISDSHIDADATKLIRETNMADNLRKVAAAVLAMKGVPAAVLHGGDVAYSTGEAGDYTAFVELVKPLREAGMPVHLMMGNHDHREHFWAAFPPGDTPKPVEDRVITLVETPKADWYLLDTLDKTNSTPGILGEKQLAWLAKSLDARPNKPAIVFTHHHPLDQYQKVTKGITDTKELNEIIVPRKQVKLLIFGHTHDWGVFDKREDGLHRINMPPTAYVFDKSRPVGWVDCILTDTGGAFTLMCLDEKHPQNGKMSTLKWR